MIVKLLSIDMRAIYLWYSYDKLTLVMGGRRNKGLVVFSADPSHRRQHIWLPAACCHAGMSCVCLRVLQTKLWFTTSRLDLYSKFQHDNHVARVHLFSFSFCMSVCLSVNLSARLFVCLCKNISVVIDFTVTNRLMAVSCLCLLGPCLGR